MFIPKGKLFWVMVLFLGVVFVVYQLIRQKKPVWSEKYHILSKNEESEIHVITNYPLMTEKPWNEHQTESNLSRLLERQLEIEETLQKNLNHTLVKTVHLLVNQPSAEQRLNKLQFHNKDKILVHRIHALPKYRDFLDYVNERLQNKLVIMMNMDIYLGEGFEKLNKTFLVKRNVAYALTRSGRQERRCNMAGRQGYCSGGRYIGSHDAYILVITQPIDEHVLSELEYNMNVAGAENVFIWFLKERLKKKALNPCKDLRTYHNPCVGIHGSLRPRINRRGKSGTVPFSGLYQ